MGRKQTRLNGVQTCVWLSRETLDKLDALVKAAGTNRRAIIEEAILKADKKSKERQTIDKIKNLLTILEGDAEGDAGRPTPEK